MIRFKAIVSICQGGRREGGREIATVLQYMNERSRYVCTCLVLHMYSSFPPPSQSDSQRGPNQISFRNRCRTTYRTCKTHFPTNFGCVINHVEIKVKGEGFDLVLGELTHVRGTRLFLHYFQLSCETDRDP